MAGRPPKVIIDNDKYKKSKEELELRELSTPIYESQNFEPPASLNEEELKVWYWLVDIFQQTKNCKVSDADVHLMEIYCQEKVTADRAQVELRKSSFCEYIYVKVGKDKDGKQKIQAKANPYRSIRKSSTAMCIRLFDQLGLSPMARARQGLASAKKQEEDIEFEKLLMRSDD